MHQLGLAKCVVKSFKYFVMGSFSNSFLRKGKRTEALVSMGKITQGYGVAIIRNSDHFPPTKYTTPILTPTRKKRNDYTGILLCIIVVSLVPRQGSNNVNKETTHISGIH